MDPHARFDSLIQFWAATDQHGYADFFERQPPVPWELIKHQLMQESRADPDAVSRVGAQGLAQAMGRTWEEWVGNEFGTNDPPPHKHLSPYDPDDAVRFMCDYMGYLLRHWNQDERRALASYNAGIGRVSRLLEQHGNSWEEHLPQETQLYLKAILG